MEQKVPVIVLNPHENIIHPLPAYGRRVRGKGCDCLQNFLRFLGLQNGQDLVHNIQTDTLPSLISAEANISFYSDFYTNEG